MVYEKKSERVRECVCVYVLSVEREKKISVKGNEAKFSIGKYE